MYTCFHICIEIIHLYKYIIQPLYHHKSCKCEYTYHLHRLGVGHKFQPSTYVVLFAHITKARSKRPRPQECFIAGNILHHPWMVGSRTVLFTLNKNEVGWLCYDFDSTHVFFNITCFTFLWKKWVQHIWSFSVYSLSPVFEFRFQSVHTAGTEAWVLGDAWKGYIYIYRL